MQKVNLILINLLIVFVLLSCDKSPNSDNLSKYTRFSNSDSDSVVTECYSIIREYIETYQMPIDVIIFFHVIPENPIFIKLYSGRLIPPPDFFKPQSFLTIDNHIVIFDLGIKNMKVYDLRFVNENKIISTSNYPYWIIERNDGVINVLK
jgi:hypothetical protein